MNPTSRPSDLNSYSYGNEPYCNGPLSLTKAALYRKHWIAMLDPHDTALDRLSKGANSTGLSVQDPFPRKVGLLLRNSERAESEKDSRNDTHSDQHRAPLKVNVQSQATSVPTVRKIDTYSSQCKNPAAWASMGSSTQKIRID